MKTNTPSFFDSQFGQVLQQYEAGLVKQRFSTHLEGTVVQLGGPLCDTYLEALPHHRYALLSTIIPHKPAPYMVRTAWDALPLEPESLSGIIIPHAAAELAKVKGIWQYLYDALQPRGVLIIVDLNPYGTWWLRESFALVPWRAQQVYSKPEKIVRSLKRAGFSDVDLQCHAWGGPSKKSLDNESSLWQRALRVLFPANGGLYTIAAMKNAHAMITPDKAQREARAPMMPKFEPTQRVRE